MKFRVSILNLFALITVYAVIFAAISALARLQIQGFAIQEQQTAAPFLISLSVWVAFIAFQISTSEVPTAVHVVVSLLAVVAGSLWVFFFIEPFSQWHHESDKVHWVDQLFDSVMFMGNSGSGLVLVLAGHAVVKRLLKSRKSSQ